VLGNGAAGGVAEEEVEEEVEEEEGEAEEAVSCMDEDGPECGDPDERIRGRGGRGLTLAEDVGVILRIGGGVRVACGSSTAGFSITTTDASCRRAGGDSLMLSVQTPSIPELAEIASSLLLRSPFITSPIFSVITPGGFVSGLSSS